MFILDVVNRVANHEVDSVAEEQRTFIERYLAAGVFIVAGAKVPRTGGVIVAQGVDRQTAEAIAGEIPFVKHGLATVVVTEFRAVFVGRALQLSPVEAL